MACSITFFPERCVQCHACEAACASWRTLEPGLRFRWVSNAWKGTYPSVSCTSANLACTQCPEPACAAACPEEAIRYSDGVVVVDPGCCTGCRACLAACADGIPQFGADGRMQKCDLCRGHFDPRDELPPCVATCPTGALVFSPPGP